MRIARLTICAAVVALFPAALDALAQNPKGTRFWNLTQNTITQLQLAPAGSDNWGPDQCKNDRDGTVDHDERLRITGIAPGRYDVKFTDKAGRHCTVRNIEVQDGAVFSIEEKQLDGCK
ncbi:MAG: hypothetical protein JOZ94_22715 [Xanthobacteraceae bacterium]|nr:hypothetical protein [Xanthobacteraceae bacterium]MBV9238661.1 hypothetical protein [Xanthobacteraceae bacterium]MBV9630645.1 hypothetical protein [Xanthobacteraceae bacterium]